MENLHPIPEKAPVGPVVQRYGLLLGLAVIAIMLVSQLMGIGPESSSTTSTILQIVQAGLIGFILYQALLTYRDRLNHGQLSVGTGFFIGFLTSLIASAIAAVFTYIFYKFLSPGTLEEMKNVAIATVEEQANVSEEQYEMSVKVLEWMMMPSVLAFTSGVMFLILGSVIGLVVALVLKRAGNLS